MLLKDYLNQEIVGVKLGVDNQGAIALLKNPIIKNRSKHVDIKYHFVREKFNSGLVNVEYVPSEENVADVMTKPIFKNQLVKFHRKLFGN